jgi:membrane-associated protease RseP (regulator of RpoE activity)
MDQLAIVITVYPDNNQEGARLTVNRRLNRRRRSVHGHLHTGKLRNFEPAGPTGLRFATQLSSVGEFVFLEIGHTDHALFKTHTFSWEELAPRIAEAATQTFGVPATVTVVDAPEPAPLTIKSLFRRISQ